MDTDWSSCRRCSDKDAPSCVTDESWNIALAALAVVGYG